MNLTLQKYKSFLLQSLFRPLIIFPLYICRPLHSACNGLIYAISGHIFARGQFQLLDLFIRATFQTITQIAEC